MKRGKPETLHAILCAIASFSSYDGAKRTYLMYRSNTSYMTLREYLRELAQSGLALERENRVFITEKGREFIATYARAMSGTNQIIR